MNFLRDKIIFITITLAFIFSLCYPFFKSKPEQTFAAAPDFSTFVAGQARKDAFFAYFKPLIGYINQQIQAQKEQLNRFYQNKDHLNARAQKQLKQLALEYRLKDFNLANDKHWETLKLRVDQVPVSLALAQAANESAWGTSRFATIANNYFGQWCFSKGCGIVPKSRTAGQSHEVAAYASAYDSVKSYIMNINTHAAYRQLRLIRANLRQSNKPVSGFALAAGLSRYSERGAEYIAEIRAMIRHNHLE